MPRLAHGISPISRISAIISSISNKFSSEILLPLVTIENLIVPDFFASLAF
jgi:hypothetical protein